jgi:hypothetical protein
MSKTCRLRSQAETAALDAKKGPNQELNAEDFEGDDLLENIGYCEEEEEDMSASVSVAMNDTTSGGKRDFVVELWAFARPVSVSTAVTMYAVPP